MAIKSGLGFEDRLIGYLQRQQFDVSHDPTLDHEYKIDFVIRKFPGNPKFHSLGVQVTTRPGEIQKMQEFAAVHASEYRVVDKVIYLEVDPRLDFEKGVGHLIAVGLSEFQFNTAHQGDKMAGVKINPDMTYSVFDISLMLSNLAKAELESRSVTPALAATAEVKTQPPPLAAEKPKPSIDFSLAASALQKGMRGDTSGGPNLPKIQGFINAYYRTRDHGFITGQNGESYFFGLAGVADGALRDRLLALPDVDWGASVEGTIEFQDVGKTRPNARYPEAKAVRLAK